MASHFRSSVDCMGLLGALVVPAAEAGARHFWDPRALSPSQAIDLPQRGAVMQRRQVIEPCGATALNTGGAR